jgi:hypothetical protein
MSIVLLRLLEDGGTMRGQRCALCEVDVDCDDDDDEGILFPDLKRWRFGVRATGSQHEGLLGPGIMRSIRFFLQYYQLDAVLCSSSAESWCFIASSRPLSRSMVRSESRVS